MYPVDGTGRLNQTDHTLLLQMVARPSITQVICNGMYNQFSMAASHIPDLTHYLALPEEARYFRIVRL